VAALTFAAVVPAARAGDSLFPADVRERMKEVWKSVLEQDALRKDLKPEDVASLEEGSARALGVLAGLTKGPDFMVRIRALAILEEVSLSSDAEVARAAMDEARSLDQMFLEKLMRGLGKREDTVAVPFLAWGLDHDTPQVRRAAVGGLTELARKAPGLASALLARAGSPTHRERGPIAQVLRWTADPAAIPYLEKLLADPERMVVFHATRSLVEFSRRGLTQDVIEAFSRRMQAADKEQRLTLIAVLGEAGGSDIIPQLAGWLRDEDPEVRKAAVQGLHKHQANREAAQRTMVQGLEAEQDVGVILHMLDRVSPEAGEAGMAALVKKLAHPDPRVQGRAVVALNEVTGAYDPAKQKSAVQWRRWARENGYADPGAPPAPAGYEPARATEHRVEPVPEAPLWKSPYVLAGAGAAALAVFFAWLHRVLTRASAARIEKKRRKVARREIY
jgi:HEAT repeat protein